MPDAVCFKDQTPCCRCGVLSWPPGAWPSAVASSSTSLISPAVFATAFALLLGAGSYKARCARSPSRTLGLALAN
eukprot:10349531-Alexandrium_andersonii.AAC.1